MKLLWIAAAFLMLCNSASAQTPEERAVAFLRFNAEVRDAAFNPRRYAPEYGDLITINYRGDDWGWPVWSIAIERFCEHAVSDAGNMMCLWRWRALAAHAPSVNAPGLRRRGEMLVENAFAMRNAAPERSLAEILEEIGVLWREADLETCPGAREALSDAMNTHWIEQSAFAASREGIPIWMHYDTIETYFRFQPGEARYHGAIVEGTPAAWGLRMSEILEPCWRPTQAPPPWR